MRSFHFFVFSSIVFHTLCASLFNIVIAPGGAGFPPHATVSFLGYFTGEVEPVFVATSVWHGHFGDLYSLNHGFEGEFLETFVEPQKMQGAEAVKPTAKMEKRVPPGSVLNNIVRPGIAQRSAGKFVGNSVLVNGPIRDRTLLSRPPFPALTNWVEANEQDVRVVFRVEVSSSGMLSAVVLERSSGYPAIDMELMRYIKQWLFVPLSPAQGKREPVQTGEVVITAPLL
ncbi:MAG: TonB family protein [Candidatus Omnitrophica bacterium]|nr:TonB family protein [Candidatus Omnitrophota bacterium]